MHHHISKVFILIIAVIISGCTTQLPSGFFSGSNSTKQAKPNSTMVEEYNRYTRQDDKLQLQIKGSNATSRNMADDDLRQPLEEEVTEKPPHISDQELSAVNASKKIFNSTSDIEFKLDINETKIMRDYFEYYTQKKHKTFQAWLKRSERYLPYIRKVFAEYDLPQDLIFLPFAESGFNPWAYSRAGAAGLWQFMPGTGRNFGLKVDWWIDERRNPYISTKAAAEYLKQLHARFDNWYLALAAYNAGEGRVAKAIHRSGKNDYFSLIRKRQYLHKETRYYVPKFMAILKIIKNLQELNFDPLDWRAPEDPPHIEVPPGTELLELAKNTGLSWEEFRKHNPYFRRPVSPSYQSCRVYLPQDKISRARIYLNSEKHASYSGYQRYSVGYGDSWWKISRRFGVPISVLKRINNRSSNLLKPGQLVLIPCSKKQFAGHGSIQGKNFKYSVYTVQQGDSLWEIAQSQNVNPGHLQQLNKLGNPNLLRVGQKLKIPQKRQAKTSSKKTREKENYTVQAGESLWSISNKFDISINTLMQANNIKNPRRLQAGSSLYIPDISSREKKQTQKEASATHDKMVHYQVRAGDNLWSIARKFGVSTQDLLAWNDLSKDLYIHPGDTLKIRID